MITFSDRQIEIMEAATSRIDKFGIQKLTIKNLAEDIGISEPALYRHFKSKNHILSSLLTYFTMEIKARLGRLTTCAYDATGDELRAIFRSQLASFVENPAIVSVIFAENIFHFNKELHTKVNDIMDLMQTYVLENISTGQHYGHYKKTINAKTLSTIITGSMRMIVLKWKVTGHKSDLVKEGNDVLESILSMIETKN